MHIEFDKDYLRELFEQGRTSDKKHRYQPEAIRGYYKCVMFLKRAESVETALPHTFFELRGAARRQERYFIRPHQYQIPSRIYSQGSSRRTGNNRMPFAGHQ